MLNTANAGTRSMGFASTAKRARIVMRRGPSLQDDAYFFFETAFTAASALMKP